MEYGIADQLKSVHIVSENTVDGELNKWFRNNLDVEVIDIKFSTSYQKGEWHADAFIIYRK